MGEEKTDEENKNQCSGCGAECCKYMSIEIDPPEELEDFEDIKWYAAHKNVRVYVDEDYEWHVEFATPCQYLGENDLCTIYSKRPKICREYDQGECTFHNEYNEKFNFKNLEEVERYIEEVFNQGKHELPEEEDDEGDDAEEDADVEEDEDVPEEGEDYIEGEGDQPEEGIEEETSDEEPEDSEESPEDREEDQPEESDESSDEEKPSDENSEASGEQSDESNAEDERPKEDSGSSDEVKEKDDSDDLDEIGGNEESRDNNNFRNF